MASNRSTHGRNQEEFILDEEPQFEKSRHVKYWLRCLKTLLPRQYTGNDSNRMYLGYFILSALDLLDALNTSTTVEERNGYVDWIYKCQHNQGGFRMWLGTHFGDRASSSNDIWDPAHIAGTYFALASLLILGDDLQRVQRRETLQWLCRMQRPDGSFGETHVNGRIQGGRDPRFGFCVAGIRFILRGNIPDGPLTIDGVAVEDVRIDDFVGCVRSAESYDGGIADEAFHEPHAGYTFCSLGAMDLFDRLNRVDEGHTPEAVRAPVNPVAVTSWLVLRQTDMTDPSDEITSMMPDHPPACLDEQNSPSETLSNLHQTPSNTVLTSFDSSPGGQSDFTSFPCQPQIFSAGMNGRPGKPADTCYAFWVLASLTILHPSEQDTSLKRTSSSLPPQSSSSMTGTFPSIRSNLSGSLSPIPPSNSSDSASSKASPSSADPSQQSPLTPTSEIPIDSNLLRRYLLLQTQNTVLGGFGKFPDDLPDLYHSYMGLAALSLLEHSLHHHTFRHDRSDDDDDDTVPTAHIPNEDGDGKECGNGNTLGSEGKSHDVQTRHDQPSNESSKSTSSAISSQIKPLDASMCISRDARARLPQIWQKWNDK